MSKSPPYGATPTTSCDTVLPTQGCALLGYAHRRTQRLHGHSRLIRPAVPLIIAKAMRAGDRPPAWMGLQEIELDEPDDARMRADDADGLKTSEKLSLAVFPFVVAGLYALAIASLSNTV